MFILKPDISDKKMHNSGDWINYSSSDADLIVIIKNEKIIEFMPKLIFNLNLTRDRG